MSSFVAKKFDINSRRRRTARLSPALSNQQKHELAERLRKQLAEVDTRRKPGSAEEAKEIVTEAIRSCRPGYCPHQ